MKQKALPGPVHKLPADFNMAIKNSKDAQEAWKLLTPLAKNEWICWVSSAKKEETRVKRINRGVQEISEGKKRPCCWPGCPHRRPSAEKWFSKKAK